jgi:hypothetical protein
LISCSKHSMLSNLCSINSNGLDVNCAIAQRKQEEIANGSD